MNPMKWLSGHKLWVSLSLIAITGGAVWWQQSHKPTLPLQYVMTSVTRGTLVKSVTGSGQVSGQNQLEIKPAVSGAITKVLVKSGQTVKINDPLFEIDQKTALKTVREASQSVSDARLSLASAQLSYNKLKQPPDALALTQSQNALAQAQRDLAKLQAGPDSFDVAQARTELTSVQQSVQISSDGKTPKLIRDAYDSSVPVLKSISQTLQQALMDGDAVIGIDNTSANDAYEHQLSVLDSSKLMSATSQYQALKRVVNNVKTEIDTLQSTNADTAAIDMALVHAQSATNLAGPFLQAVYDALTATITTPTFTQSTLSSLQSGIQSDRSSVATKLTSITSEVQSLASAKTSFTSAQLNVQKAQSALDKLLAGASANDIASAQERVMEAQKSLDKLQKGTDPVDLALSLNSMQQRQSSYNDAVRKLSDAQQALLDYTVRAPFDGVVANITAQVSDQAGSTALATLVTPTKLAEISLNEIDATRIHVGQKATVTFDAVPDLNIAGNVYEVNPLGTVTQGVVNYTVKVAFQTQDDRIKSGMSASVSIITDISADVLMLPSSAVHTQAGNSTVQVLANLPITTLENAQEAISSATPPASKTVQIGLSNDQNIEIVSGLEEGEQVVLRTIDPNATTVKTTTQTNSALRIPGVGGAATGFGGGATGRPGAAIGR